MEDAVCFLPLERCVIYSMDVIRNRVEVDFLINGNVKQLNIGVIEYPDTYTAIC